MARHCIFLLFFISLMIFGCGGSDHIFYLSPLGNDENDGDRSNPWKSIERLNMADLQPGDSVYLESGASFEGILTLDSADSGTKKDPVVIISSGDKKATIAGRNGAAIRVKGARHVELRNLHLIGSGRMGGNTTPGLEVNNSSFVTVDSLEVEGFQKSGVEITSSSHVIVDAVHAHDNGAAGISVGSASRKTDSRDIIIRNCLAENNPGDPTNLTNHSGNGIIAGLCTNVLIEYCVATNNGWDMPRIGNGPVGIWAYEADSVVIDHCISYRNKTSKGGDDGGGFDLDGGTTNSVIQYCLSYENEGSGFGIFQYAGASVWKNNHIRFNISENDGLVSAAHAGIYIWNGSDIEQDFTECYVYNNVISNESGAVINFAPLSKRDKFQYYNNIFISRDEFLKGLSLHDTFQYNDWHSVDDGFNMAGLKSFEVWVKRSGQELVKGQVVGLNLDPAFSYVNEPIRIRDPRELPSFIKYQLQENSLLRQRSFDIKEKFGVDFVDFNMNPYSKGIGASF